MKKKVVVSIVNGEVTVLMADENNVLRVVPLAEVLPHLPHFRADSVKYRKKSSEGFKYAFTMHDPEQADYERGFMN